MQDLLSTGDWKVHVSHTIQAFSSKLNDVHKISKALAKSRKIIHRTLILLLEY